MTLLPTLQQYKDLQEKLIYTEKTVEDYKTSNTSFLKEHKASVARIEHLEHKLQIALGGTMDMSSDDEDGRQTPRPKWCKAVELGFLDQKMIEETTTGDLVGRLLMDIKFLQDK
eukprot:UN28697